MTAWPVVQRGFAALGLAIVAPALLVLAVAVRVTSGAPAVHRAIRVGSGKTFTLYKLRTMRAGSEALGPGVTAATDARITRLGRVLRRTKLDELPQLWNVVRGDMLLVGPRPEDPRYVDFGDPLHRFVFSAHSGLTGPTALAFEREEFLLSNAAMELARAQGREDATAEDVDQAYRTIILPTKLQMDADYVASRSVRGDLAVMALTARRVLVRRPRPPTIAKNTSRL
jgi:lipopolysaccharide/colanic/teichoic acid biosynthesis glycosyltransferase